MWSRVSSLVLAAIGVASIVLPAHADNQIKNEVMPLDATGRYYASIFVGPSFSSSLRNDWNPSFYEKFDLSTGWTLGIAAGMRVMPWLRAEVEISHQKFETERSYQVLDGSVLSSIPEDHDMSATYLLGNVWADIRTSYPITPYIGGGLGAAWLDLDGIWSTPGGATRVDGDVAFAWQLGGGVQYEFTESWALDVGYRYKRVESAHLAASPGGQDFEGTLQSHTIQVGLTRRF
jgi:opacity protein-like surface antigen